MVRKLGFTIAEVLLSLGFLTVVLLTLLGLATQALQSNRKNLDTAAGQLVADQALERITYDAEQSASATVWGVNSLTVPMSSTIVTMGSIPYEVTLYANDSLTVAGKRLKRIRARVIWADAPNGKAGQGQLKVEAARLVHEP